MQREANHLNLKRNDPRVIIMNNGFPSHQHKHTEVKMERTLSKNRAEILFGSEIKEKFPIAQRLRDPRIGSPSQIKEIRAVAWGHVSDQMRVDANRSGNVNAAASSGDLHVKERDDQRDQSF
ncbi:hypothetical protein YC2023_039467 [Brassica napus]